MPETKDLFLGFDPGGHGRPSSKGKFGWSICGEVDGLLQERLQTGLAHDAWEAINQVKGAIASLGPRDNPWVRAAGIDAPLLWNKRGDRKGYRKADCVLRRTLRDQNLPTASVLAPNALYGATTDGGPGSDRQTRPHAPQTGRHALCSLGLGNGASPKIVWMAEPLRRGFRPPQPVPDTSRLLDAYP